MLKDLKSIEDLRDELHNAIEEGNWDNILHKSKVLDVQILKFIHSGKFLRNKPIIYWAK